MLKHVYEHFARSLRVFKRCRSQILMLLLNEKITGLTHLNPKHDWELMLKMVLRPQFIIFCFTDYVYGPIKFMFIIIIGTIIIIIIYFSLFFFMFRYYLLSYGAFLLFMFVAYDQHFMFFSNICNFSIAFLIALSWILFSNLLQFQL